MNLFLGDEYQDRGSPMIPKLTMKSCDCCRLDLVDLFEVDEWHILSTENAVQLQQVKGTPQDMRLRGINAGRIQLQFGGEEYLSLSKSDAELLLPIFVRRRSHRTLPTSIRTA